MSYISDFYTSVLGFNIVLLILNSAYMSVFRHVAYQTYDDQSLAFSPVYLNKLFIYFKPCNSISDPSSNSNRKKNLI